ncbi:MAG: TrkA family potassium uptake protein [Chloroflexi bacterium]|nr:TrkA family potassium uptake protein [Chloroflexota bacterium]
MNVIIMGCGRVGAQLAGLLASSGHHVTIMDIDSGNFSALFPSFKGTALLGDGTDEDSLRKAGIEEADAFVAVGERDNRNVMAAQVAKHIFNVPRVICRVDDPLREDLYRDLGLEAVSPTRVFAELLSDKLLNRDKQCT